MGLQPPRKDSLGLKSSHPASFGDRDVAGTGTGPLKPQVKLGRVEALALASEIPSHLLTCSPKRVAVFL